MKYQAKNSEFHLSPAELRKLVAAADNPRDRLVLELFVYTGIRRAELQKIFVEDLDFVRRRLVIQHGKGAKQRIVYLPDVVVDSLKAFCARLRGGPIFVGRNGTPLSLRAINYIVSRVADAACLQTPNPRYRHVSPHLLRHSFARNWKVAGGSLETLRRILGHSSLKTTLDLYGTESQADAEENYRALVSKLM
jgi:integrase/recombinase XerD